MDKFALITGGARRVGKYLSQYLASEGYDLVIHVNKSLEAGKELVEELMHKYPGQRFSVVQFDLNDWSELEPRINDIFEQYGLPSLVIHNASQYTPGTLSETTPEMMEAMMAIHLFSPMVIGRQYKNAGGKGSIISILDTAITTNHSSHAMYLLAKKSLAEYTKMAAQEWAPQIRVNGVALGPVLPPEGKDDSYFKQVVADTPLQREVDLASISGSIDYLVANPNVSGQIIYCDSAQHLL
ncbi:SDR family NAD(P)-dependent oxidoreductase [Carboxylicivirga taeanensis]|uniref:SDR family NAD(P)-dependent oxidoreductase n=1 Tax=Carboxylicivirga taeanensis TaxID=1416875 RepID=UPI003F6DDEFC